MEIKRVNVETDVRFGREGGLRPLWLIWEDGRKFEIDRVKRVDRAPSQAGSVLPVRYTCVVEGKEKRLYFEPERMAWFVEMVEG